MARPARFHALRDRVMAQVDRTFAEPVRIAFFLEGAKDPDRLAVDIEAVLRAGRGRESTMSGGYSDNWHSKLAAGAGELHVNPKAYPMFRAKPGDRVCALARPGQPWFEVLRVDDRGVTRLVLSLGEI